MRQSTVWRGIAVACLLGMGPQAHAGWGEENLLLGEIAANTLREAAHLEESIQFLKATSEYARDTAAFARESVQVGKNIQTLLDDPADFFAYAMRSWAQAFPELEDVLANAASVRESLDAATHPESLPLYDPYAYVRSFDRLHSMVGSGFEAWAHAIDTWGINESHDAAIQNLQVQHQIALKNLEKVADAINSSTLSPVQASINTATATAVSATAQVEAAATLHHLNRTAEQMLAGMGESAGRQQRQRRLEQDAAVHVYAPSWRLQPLQPPRKFHPLER